jgi:hypothetical protein
MTATSTLVAVETRGLVAAASAAWRHRGNTRATVVVKADFSYADGQLTQVQAEPVRRDTEMAFLLAHAELLFAGLAHSGDSMTPARISVWRGSQELLSQAVCAPATGGAGLGGRIAPFAAERAQYLRGVSPSIFDQPFVDLPDAFDPTFFQAAPPAQRLAALAGGDMVVLDNSYPGHRRFMLQLPNAQATGTGNMEGRSVPINFRLDTVVIDAARHRCTMLWRGRMAASQPDALSRTRAVVELLMQDAGRVQGDHAAPQSQLPHAVESSPSPPSTPAAASGAPASAPHSASKFESTSAMGADAIAQALASAVTPFAQTPPSDRPAQSGGAIPGAPWSAEAAPAVLPAEGVKETVGLGDIVNTAAPGEAPKLPKGIKVRRSNKPVRIPGAAEPPAAVQSPAAVQPPAAMQPPAAVPPAAVQTPAAVPPAAVPPAAVPPSAVPPSAVPPSAVPPSAVPPSAVPPAAVPPAAVPPAAVPASAVPPAAVPSTVPDSSAAMQAEAHAQRQEAERLEAERRAAEAAAEEQRRAAEAAVEAEERRRLEAERFQAEQLAAQKAAADHEARQIAERKKSAKKIKTATYGKFKRKK